jgi:hypothetical protein
LLSCSLYKQINGISVASTTKIGGKCGRMLVSVPHDLISNALFRRSFWSSELTSPQDAQSLRMAGSLQGLNVLRSKHERQQQKLQPLLAQCAPHLALQLYDLQDIYFSRDLPLTRRMRERRLDLSNPDKVVHTRLPSATESSSKASSTASSIRSSIGRHLRLPSPRNRKKYSPKIFTN